MKNKQIIYADYVDFSEHFFLSLFNKLMCLSINIGLLSCYIALMSIISFTISFAHFKYLSDGNSWQKCGKI